MDDTLDTSAGAKWFSTLDMVSRWRYVADDDKEKTAFCTPDGLYEFNVLFCNGPATFQRLMDSGLQWSSCLVYLDDIIVVRRSFHEHLQNSENLFQRLQNAGLKFKPKKCTFLRKEVLYLGHLVSREGIATDRGRISKVAGWPVPTTVQEVQRFLRFASYYRRFIRDFAEIAKPLYRLTTEFSV